MRMDNYVATLKRSCRRDGVVRYAVTVVHNQRELSACHTILAAIGRSRGECVITRGEENQSIACSAHLYVGFALQRG